MWGRAQDVKKFRRILGDTLKDLSLRTKKDILLVLAKTKLQYSDQERVKEGITPRYFMEGTWFNDSPLAHRE